MNRRSFLAFLGIAPVAAPAAVEASVIERTDGAYAEAPVYDGLSIPFELTGPDALLGMRYVPAARNPIYSSVQCVTEGGETLWDFGSSRWEVINRVEDEVARPGDIR